MSEDITITAQDTIKPDLAKFPQEKFSTWEGHNKLAPGKTLYLKGSFEFLKINNLIGTQENPIYIKPVGEVKIKRLKLYNMEFVTFDGLGQTTVSSIFEGDPTNKQPLLSILKGKDTTIQNLHICSAEDSSSWDHRNWKEMSSDGVSVNKESRSCNIKNNKIKNVAVAIRLDSPESKAEGNIINNYCNDGILLSKDKTKAINNTIAYSYKDCEGEVDCRKFSTDGLGNHNDAIQAFKKDKPIEDVQIRGNVILCPAGEKFKENAQGILCADKGSIRMKVFDNLVCCHHSEGIALKYAQDAEIIGNTVVPYDMASSNPNIRTSEDKGENNKISGNKHGGVGKIMSDGIDVTKDGNTKLKDADSDSIKQEIIDMAKLTN